MKMKLLHEFCHDYGSIIVLRKLDRMVFCDESLSFMISDLMGLSSAASASTLKKRSSGHGLSSRLVFSNSQFHSGLLDALVVFRGELHHQQQQSTRPLLRIQFGDRERDKHFLWDVNVILKSMGIHSSIVADTTTRPSVLEIRGSRNVNRLCAHHMNFFDTSSSSSPPSCFGKRLSHRIASTISCLVHNKMKKLLLEEASVEEEEDIDDDKLFADEVVCIEETASFSAISNLAYDLTVADTRNFDVYNGLCMRDTFHNAGVSSKTNVTRGVPRIEQILRLSKNVKKNSMTIFLREDVEKNKDEVLRISKKIEKTKLADVVSLVQIWFDPNDTNTNVPEDRLLMKQYREFETWIRRSNNSNSGGGGVSELLVKKKMTKKELRLEEVRKKMREMRKLRESEKTATSTTTAVNNEAGGVDRREEEDDDEEEEADEEDEEDSVESHKSKWIIRFEFDKKRMFDKNISMEDINFAVRNSPFRDFVECVYSDYNTDRNLVMRIRPDKAIFKLKSMAYRGDKRSKKQQPSATATTSSATTSATEAVVPEQDTGAPPPAEEKVFDQFDEIYALKKFQQSLLEDIVLQGTYGITNASIRELKNVVKYTEGQYRRNDVWVIDTTGSNLMEVLALGGAGSGGFTDLEAIDYRRTYSNDIREVFDVLGIEAAREILMQEIMEVMSEVYIDYHHLSLLCDRMTANKEMVPIFRSGILSDHIGCISKSTFEVHTETLLTAARHGLLDNMRGVSANVMCGQHGFFGTNAFDVLLDMDKFSHIDTSSSWDKIESLGRVEKVITRNIAYERQDDSILSFIKKLQNKEEDHQARCLEITTRFDEEGETGNDVGF